VLVGRRGIGALDSEVFKIDTYCQADLSQAECAERVCEFLRVQKIEAVDLAIQNTGVGYYGQVADQAVESIWEVMAVNLLAPIRLVHALASQMKKVNGKHLLIGSMAHAFPCPEYAVYAASKEALNALGRNLRIEGNLNVQVIHPGATRTGMHQKIGLAPEKVEGFPPADRVANQIARAIDGRRSVVTVGLANAWGRFVGRFFDGLVDVLMRRGAR
jgi:short-subunit dehydrogenase